VVVPVFNLEPFLAETIDAVLAQTCQDFEIILVDDGSTDGSRAIIDRYYRQEPERVRGLFRDHGGAPAARNAGLDQVRGQWIAFLDGDDLWLPDKLARQLAAVTAEPSLNLVATLASVLGSERLLREPISAGDDLRCALLLEGCFFPLSSVLIHRNLIGDTRFDEQLPGAQDLDFFFQLADRARYRVLAEPLVRYRIRPGAISDPATTHFQQLREQLRLIERERPKLLASQPERHRELAAQLDRLATTLAHVAAYYALGSTQASPWIRLRLSWQAVRWDPRRTKNYRFLAQSLLPAAVNRWIQAAGSNEAPR